VYYLPFPCSGGTWVHDRHLPDDFLSTWAILSYIWKRISDLASYFHVVDTEMFLMLH
jgi:hypothetical protein